MSQLERVRHQFVDSIPERMDNGIVYVSIPFDMAAHRCCCGCGNEVFTPLAPHRWRVTYDGATISLADSIGNWSFPCQSHYFITRNEVLWCDRWTPQQIEAGRQHTKESIAQAASSAPEPVRVPPQSRFLRRMLDRLRRG